MEERREGRERLQRVAALVVLDDMCAVPAAQRLPQTPAAALALGVLASWRSHCQVRSSQSAMLPLAKALAPCNVLIHRAPQRVVTPNPACLLANVPALLTGLTVCAVMTHLIQSLMGM